MILCRKNIRSFSCKIEVRMNTLTLKIGARAIIGSSVIGLIAGVGVKLMLVSETAFVLSFIFIAVFLGMLSFGLGSLITDLKDKCGINFLHMGLCGCIILGNLTGVMFGPITGLAVWFVVSVAIELIFALLWSVRNLLSECILCAKN